MCGTRTRAALSKCVKSLSRGLRSKVELVVVCEEGGYMWLVVSVAVAVAVAVASVCVCFCGQPPPRLYKRLYMPSFPE